MDALLIVDVVAPCDAVAALTVAIVLVDDVGSPNGSP